jgi:hypothetical protein
LLADTCSIIPRLGTEEAEDKEWKELKEKKHLLIDAGKKLDSSDEARLKALKLKRNSKVWRFGVIAFLGPLRGCFL